MAVCCGSSYSTGVGLLAHLRSPLHYAGTSCPVCRISFRSHEILAGHLFTVLHLLPAYPLAEINCSRCGRRFENENQFIYDEDLHEFHCDSRQTVCRAITVLQTSAYSGPPRSWFGAIQHIITSTVEYMEVPDPRVLVQEAVRQSALAPRVLVQEALRQSALAISALQLPLIRPSPPSAARTVSVTPRSQWDIPPSSSFGPSRVPERSSSGISTISVAPVRHTSPPTTSQRGISASNSTWADILNSSATPISPSQRPSVLLGHNVIQRANHWRALSQLDAARTSAEGATASGRSPALVQPAPLPPAPPISIASPCQSAVGIAPVTQLPARQSTHLAVPSIPRLAAVQPAPRPAASSPTPPASHRASSGPAHRGTPHPAANAPRQQPTPPSFRCDHCDRKFSSRHALNCHRTAVHVRNPLPAQVARAREIADAPRSTCMSCRRTFIDQYALDQHLVSNAHPENQVGGRPGHRCVECGMVLGTRDLWTLHSAAHVRERMGGA